MSSSFYETPALVAQYLLFHYGTDDQQLPYSEGPRGALHFPARCVNECLDRATVPETGRALDIGCSVGRSAFELTRYFPEVLAVDLSHGFIQAAQTLQQQGSITCQVPIEGEITEEMTFCAPMGLIRDRVRFMVGDALQLSPTWGTFDCVLAANLLDRVPDPQRLLAGFRNLVRSDGRLIVTSPYTWLETFTPRSHWPSGTTLDFLQASLSPHFSLQGRCDLPFLIREHARKFQWSVAEATIWQRNAS